MFSEDLNSLDFLVDEEEDTYVQLLLEIKSFTLNIYGTVVYNREFKLPLYKGTGQFLVGSVVHQLFEEIKSLEEVVPDFEGNYSRSQYCQVRLKLILILKVMLKMKLLPLE